MTDAARTFSPLPPVERLRPGLWSIPVPIPSAPTMLLAVGGMALLFGRWLPVSRWYERVWLTAIVGACWLIFADDAKPAPQALDGATSAWIAEIGRAHV